VSDEPGHPGKSLRPRDAFSLLHIEVVVGSIATAYPFAADPSDRSDPFAWSKLARAAPLPAAAQLRITGYDHENGAVVAAAGELDVASGPLLADHLAELAARLRARVVLDLAHLDFCDCAGLSVLLRAHRRFAEDGGWLRLTAPRPTIRKTLRITGLARVLTCYPSIASAFHDPFARPRPSPGELHD
jgi:anti-sigma B factor antagonist